MNDYQLQLECDLALKRVMHRVDVFIRNEKRLWEFINIWHPMGVYPYYATEYPTNEHIITQSDRDSFIFNIDHILFNKFEDKCIDGGKTSWHILDEMGQSC